jgi:AcrR family transcriptional regulator
MGLRERTRAATTEEIERAAVALFEEKGCAATTVAEIAAVSGVSVRTFFRYFASKEDVVFVDSEKQLAALRREVLDAARHGSEVEVLRTAVRALARNLQRDPEAEARARLAIRDPSLAGRVAATKAAWVQALAESLAQAKGRRRPGLDERVLANSVVGALTVALEMWIAGEGADLDRLVCKALDRVAHLHGAAAVRD